MENLIPKIGLEVHLELETKTKLFCNCKNDPNELTPNKNICPVCTGQPGVLPVLNKEAVIKALSLAKALKMTINKKSLFARKHYFYPDLPKNYQISQYELPLAINGEVILIRENLRKKIRIRRIHLEEDTAKNIHYQNYSLVDFNRAGIPLVEIVTEPDLNSAEEVEIFAEELVLLIRELKISSADAEKGQIRFEANVSLGKNDNLGIKVEVKNIGSIQSLKEAVNYEIERQKNVLKKGEKILQETRGFDEIKKITFSQRAKEEAEDYRYFSDPDLPPLLIDQALEQEIIFVETPWDKKIRFENEYKIEPKISQILIKNSFLSHLFEETFSELYKMTNNFEESKKLILNYIINDISGLIEKLKINLKEELLSPHEFAHLLFAFYQNKISSKIVKEALELSLKGEEKIENILKEKEKISDVEFLNSLIEEVFKENPKTIFDYKNGKKEVFEFLIGKAMAKSKGRADPFILREILKDKLENINGR